MRRGRAGRERPARLWRALAVSVIGHGLLVLALLRGRPLRPPPAPDEVLAIDLLDAGVVLGPATEAPPPSPATPARTPPLGGGRAATPRRETRAARGPVQAAPAPPPADGPGWLTMRGPQDRSLPPTPPHGPDVPLAPPRDPLGMSPSALPNVIHHAVGQTAGSPGGHLAESGVTARVGQDGAVTFRDPAAAEDVHVGPITNGIGVRGKFDLTDHVLRAMGDDPYAYAKKKYREATFEERLCLAEKAAVGRKRDALFQLKTRLEGLLADPSLSLAHRHELVFEMWDECVDAGADGLDLGAAARATVMAFIRRAFPPDGPDAYLASELATLNRRRTSRAPFDPYGARATIR